MLERGSNRWWIVLCFVVLGLYFASKIGSAQAQPIAPAWEKRVAKLEQQSEALLLAIEFVGEVLDERKVINSQEFRERLNGRLKKEFPGLDREWRIKDAKLTQCTLNLRNIHLACIQYSDEHNFLPGHGAKEPGVEGIRQLIRTGHLTQMKTLICPASNDSLKDIEHLLRNGSVLPGKEAEVAERIRLDDEGGTCSYVISGRTLPQSTIDSSPLMVDAHHPVADFPRFFGSKPSGHPGGFNRLTADGAIEFIKLEPGGYDHVTEIKRAMTQQP